MKTLILGNGLIARAIAKKLLVAGHDVTIISRRISDEIPGVKYVQLSLEEMATRKELFSNADNVLHTISTTSPASSMTDIFRDAHDNILQNVKLMDTLSGAGIKKFIFFSSGGAVYGNPSMVKVNEEHPTNPVSAYGVAKLSIEKYLYLYGYHHDLNYLIIRPSNVYGYIKTISKPQGVINHLLDCARNNKPFRLWGSVENRKDYLYVDDLADATLIALGKEGNYATKIYNVSFGKTYSLADIIAIIEKKTGTALRIEQVEATRFDVKNIDVDSNLFKKDFNWNPSFDIEEGISGIIDQI